MRNPTNEEELHVRDLEGRAASSASKTQRVQRKVVRAAGVARMHGDPTALKISTGGLVYLPNVKDGDEPVAELASKDYEELCTAFEVAEVAADKLADATDDLREVCGAPSYALINPAGLWVDPKKPQEPLAPEEETSDE